MKKVAFIFFILTLFNFAQAQVNSFDSFSESYASLLKNNVIDGKVNYSVIKQSVIRNEIKDFIATANPSTLSSSELKAFRINAYNFTVINLIAENYPINSVQEINGFFDDKKHTIEGKTFTLNKYEKEFILKIFNDPRLHFVLNCGAIDCPPLIASVYTAENLNEKLTFQTKQALDNPSFLKISDDKIELSQIFNWYINDFGGTKRTIVAFINQYRSNPIKLRDNISYYDYDWTLNDTQSSIKTKDNADFRYVVSSTIPQGTYEFKAFNNLYSQDVNNQRSTFFTTIFSGLYGLNRRVNVGIAGRFRAVSNHSGESSPFDVFGFRNTTSQRIGLTALGPIVRVAPVQKWKNFSIQSTFTFPIGKDLGGNPWIDWDGAFWNTQFFNDFTLSSKFSLFTEIDLLIEDIGFDFENSAYRVSTPVTLIGSYFPTPKTTFYIISGYSPFWQATYDYFYQVGTGAKYQFTPDFEVELLYTAFRNKYILTNDGNAATYNLGIRYNL